MNKNKSSRPSDLVTVDDFAPDIMVRKGRALARRVVARVVKDAATGRLLTLKLEKAGARLTPWAKGCIERGFHLSTGTERVRIGGCFVFFKEENDPWHGVEVKVVAKHRGKFRVRIANAAQRALAKGRRLAVRTVTDAELW